MPYLCRFCTFRRIVRRPAAAAVLALAFTAAVAAAGPARTPPTLTGATVVTAEQAADLMRRGVLMVDTRVAHEYVEEHIRGAVSVPYKEQSAKSMDYDSRLDQFDLARLPTDRAAPMIFYCNAGECWKSYKACKAAIRAGYTRVYWLRGGIPEWRTKGFPVE